MNQRKTNGALALLALFLFASLLYGCGRSKETVKNPTLIASDAQAVENKEDANDDDREKKAGFSSENPKNDENAAIRTLGDATDRFSQIFSESGEERLESDWDATLVDEETRKKFSADRTAVAPTLAPRSENAETAELPKFRLEYRFQPNSSLAWNVVHRVRKKIGYGGKTRAIETSSTTFRRWDFGEADPNDGKIAARHAVDRMILLQNEEEKEPIEYDSERDLVVPKEIAAFGTEKTVGVVLETFRIDPFGVMSEKKKLVPEYQGREGESNVLVPFPKEEIALGDVWTVPYAIYLKGADGVTRAYQVVERFRLEKIDEKYATISFKTTLMSIVDDPVVEGALAERLFTGRALFDRELGLNLRIEMTFEKSVANAFGDSSFLEYHCQVVEKLIRDDDENADASEFVESNVANEIEPNAEQKESPNAVSTVEQVDAPESSEVGSENY